MKTIKNAMQILAAFKDNEGPLGVSDIARLFGYEKSYVSRVLSTMRDMNFLVQDPFSRKYTVGLEAFALGVRYITDTPLTRIALPVMREITRNTNDSVFLSIRHGDVCRHILAVEGEHFLETRSRLGVRLPLHASASGKALLAFAPTDEQQNLLAEIELCAFTGKTITTHAALQREIERIRERGLSCSREEAVYGLAGWATPIYGEDGRMVAALSIVMPESAAAIKDQSEIAQTLHSGARKLSSLCGARVYPH